jgi:hypothetical protein
MSVNKSWRTIFDLEFEGRETYAAEFVGFEQFKKPLLGHLRSAYERGPKSEPFDEDDVWRALIHAAVWYFKRSIIKQKPLLPAHRVERLCDLAKTLGRARNMVHKAMQDDVGIDLFGGWCAEAKITEESARVLNDNNWLLSVADKITAAVASLATLEAAASRAARDLPVKTGPRRGSGILSQGDILSLAVLYGRNAGHREPYSVLGTKPFAEFVQEFLIAVGRSDDTSEDTVVEALKYARKQVAREVRKAGSP